jgi:hypothetical protein
MRCTLWGPPVPRRRVMAACRSLGYPVIHTREGHRPDLSDLPANKRWRSDQIGERGLLARPAAVHDVGRLSSRGMGSP